MNQLPVLNRGLSFLHSGSNKTIKHKGNLPLLESNNLWWHGLSWNAKVPYIPKQCMGYTNVFTHQTIGQISIPWSMTPSCMKHYHPKSGSHYQKAREIGLLSSQQQKDCFFLHKANHTGFSNRNSSSNPSLIVLSFEQWSSFGFCTSELLPFKMLQRVWGFLALVPSMKLVPNLEKRLRIVFKRWQRIARIFVC